MGSRQYLVIIRSTDYKITNDKSMTENLRCTDTIWVIFVLLLTGDEACVKVKLFSHILSKTKAATFSYT